MAELSNDTVIRVVLGTLDATDRRVLERVLAGQSGVTAFEVSDDGVLVASLVSEAEHEALARALWTAGIVPVSANELGGSQEGGSNAC